MNFEKEGVQSVIPAVFVLEPPSEYSFHSDKERIPVHGSGVFEIMLFTSPTLP